MQQSNKLWKSTATLLIAVSIVLSGCGSNNDGVPVPTPSSDVVTDQDQNASNDQQDDVVDPSASPDQEPTASPEVSTTPDANTEATASPTPTAKPTATVKPTDDTATSKPSATTKPTTKPSATSKPTAAPTSKPNATVKPTAKPTAKPTTKPTTAPEASIVISDIMDKIKTDAEMGSMMSVTGDQIADMFYLDSDQYAEGVFQVAMMNVKSWDLAIVKLKNKSDYETVKSALTKRAEDVIERFSTYLPDQHENAKNYQIVQRGLYVLYSISEDQDKVLEVFDSYVK